MDANYRHFVWLIATITWAAMPGVSWGGADTTPTKNGDTTQAVAGNRVVARGVGVEITQRDMDQVLNSVKANASEQDIPLPGEAEVQVLNQLIDIPLALHQATDADKAEGKKQGDAAFDAIVKKYASRGEFDKQLAAAGMTEDDLRLKVIQESTAKVSLLDNLGIHVTDEEVKKFFETRGPGAYDVPPMAHVREIFLWTTKPFSEERLPAETVDKKRKLIDDLLKRLRTGEDFAALAKKYSEDLDSRDQGGEMAPFPEHREGIGAAAFSMKPNDISDVIVTDDALYIIQLINIIPLKKMELADVSDRIRNFLTVRKMTESAPAYLAKLRREAGVEIVDRRLREAMAASK